MNKLKQFFSTPKKAIITGLCLVAAVVVIGFGGMAIAKTWVENTGIGKSGAEYYALTDAGVEYTDAKFTKNEMDREDGVFVYDVEFTANGNAYEYTINATNGTILSKEINDKDMMVPINNKPAEETVVPETKAETKQESKPTVEKPTEETVAETAKQATNNGEVTLEQAKDIVLKDANVSKADATFTKEKTDYDYGENVYDIEFYTATTEYDYEVSIATGAIVERSSEAIHTTSGGQNTTSGNNSGSTTTTTTDIGVEKAKEIATSDAGTGSNVQFSKAKLDRDDGIAVYEIEFYVGRTEYDYTINAATGAIIEKDVDYED